MNDNQNLTTGNVSRKLTAFALPLLAANLLQSFYSIVDMLVVTLAFLTAGVVTVLSLFTYEPLFKVLNVPDVAMEDACGYMKIICFGTIFVFGYNALCSILKGLGDSKSPLYFVAIATAVNIVLDLLLVGPSDMGTKGAAYATIFSQGISFVISKSDTFVFSNRSTFCTPIY